jgi:hypothetical protein
MLAEIEGAKGAATGSGNGAAVFAVALSGSVTFFVEGEGRVMVGVAIAAIGVISITKANRQAIKAFELPGAVGVDWYIISP